MTSESPTADHNAQLLVRLLKQPESGSVMEWFVMMAIEEFAERILEKGPQGLDNPLVDPKDLIACAKEAKTAMEQWQV